MQELSLTNKLTGAVAKIRSLGAELVSLKTTDGKERIWQGDAEIWGRHSPVLFPFVGKLKNNRILHNGRTYPMSQHGFARDKEFRLVYHDENSCAWELKSDEFTLSVYPFPFVFRVIHAWKGNVFRTSFNVENTSDKTMLFGLGGHPGFCWNENELFLQFQEEENALRFFVEEGLISERTEPVFQNGNKLHFNKSSFDQDAWVFKNLQSESLKLLNANGELYMKMRWHNFPHFGIWSKKGLPGFICLEPWASYADVLHSAGELNEKESVLKLEPKEIFSAFYEFDFS